jgi:hypothetical protein
LFVEPGNGLFEVAGKGFLVLSGTGLGLKNVGVGSALVGFAVGVGVGLATST